MASLVTLVGGGIQLVDEYGNACPLDAYAGVLPRVKVRMPGFDPSQRDNNASMIGRRSHSEDGSEGTELGDMPHHGCPDAP